MKFLIIQPKIDYRGAETVAVNQCFYLSKLGYSTRIATVYVDSSRLPPHAREVEYILPPRLISNICRYSSLVSVIVGIPFLLFKVIINCRNFDVLVPHNFPSVWIALIAGKLFNKRVVWIVHNIPRVISWKDKRDILEYVGWRIASSLIDIIIVNQVDLIISMSKRVAGEVKDRYKSDSEVIYPGLDKKTCRIKQLPEYIKELRKRSKLLLLQIGQLHPQKNQQLTLKAIKKLRKDGLEVSVIFVGEGPDRKFLEDKSKKMKLEKNVLFIGYVYPDIIGAYYKICDLNLQPSFNETFSATPLEALYNSKPSIVTDDSGVLEIISEYAIAIKPNVNSLVNAILQFEKNKKQYIAQAIKGKKKIDKLLNWKRSCKDFIKAILRMTHHSC